MPYHWLDFTPPQPQIAAAPVEDFVTAASNPTVRATASMSLGCFGSWQRT